MKDEHTTDTMRKADAAQGAFFRATDRVPEAAWYWLALGAIGVSAWLRLGQKAHWALFVGQWPPTFLLFGLFHRLLRPGGR